MAIHAGMGTPFARLRRLKVRGRNRRARSLGRSGQAFFRVLPREVRLVVVAQEVLLEVAISGHSTDRMKEADELPGQVELVRQEAVASRALIQVVVVVPLAGD